MVMFISAELVYEDAPAICKRARTASNTRYRLPAARARMDWFNHRPIYLPVKSCKIHPRSGITLGFL
jgi:hypothetical protein